MASCIVCGKKRVIGNHVSHANNRVKRIIMPNLQRTKVSTSGGIKRANVCTRCLRSGSIKKIV